MAIYGFCPLAIVPLRREASDKSEMVSQLLFGDVCEILEKTPKWLKIRMLFDGYDGWADAKQIKEISLSEKEEIVAWQNFSLSLSDTIYCNGSIMPIVKGTLLPLASNFQIQGKDFSYCVQTVKFENPEKSLLEIAFDYLGSPYLWGGRTPFGIDCSGFVQMVFKTKQISLLRDAWQQAQQGKPVDSFSEMKPGDVAFFDNDAGNIIHVGIYCGEGKIIHACGSVRIDLLDEKGIFNQENQQYSHQLKLIRRMI